TDAFGEFTGETIIDKPSLEYLTINTLFEVKYNIKEVISPFISLGPRFDYLVKNSYHFDDIEDIQEYLSSIFDKKAQIIIPKIGKKKQLIDLAILNAKELLKNDKKTIDFKIENQLLELLNLQKFPQRVECFDNSHMSGMATVGAMIVYDNAKFDKKSYRTYHLDAKDEYSQMRETLTRRVNSFEKSSPPDLWVLDGGATLLKLALDILESSGVNIDVIAISKEKVDEKAHRAKGSAKDIIYTKYEVFRLKSSDKRLHWVQNLRDEAHRCAISFHKKTKLKLDQESKLLNLNGISQAKVKKLLNHFGTFEQIKTLSIDEIATILNVKDANIVKKMYK
ncbi:MAG: excinuclease ABC subunit C, partial [Thiovulaceae bacterium]|nr:excinuclease ABC subunit C [Sulfurimonadaceae bacterium]